MEEEEIILENVEKRSEAMNIVAIPVRDNQVNEHLGESNYINIYKIRDGKIEVIESLEKDRGFQWSVLNSLLEKDVDTMIVGHIGERALSKLKTTDIKLYYGIEGKVDEVLKKFMVNELESKDLKDSKDCAHKRRGQDALNLTKKRVASKPYRSSHIEYKKNFSGHRHGCKKDKGHGLGCGCESNQGLGHRCGEKQGQGFKFGF